MLPTVTAEQLTAFVVAAAAIMFVAKLAKDLFYGDRGTSKEGATKGELADLKAELAGVKNELAAVKEKLATCATKTEMAEMQTDLRDRHHKLVDALNAINLKVATLRGEIMQDLTAPFTKLQAGVEFSHVALARLSALFEAKLGTPPAPLPVRPEES